MKYEHDHENDVIYFAKTNFRNAMRKFGIKTDDRRRHCYIIGKTGMGKTTLLENMILSDIYAGHGACYIDPHGDTAEMLLDHIPSWRINDVVYFNPADTENPVGFNILESVDDSMKHLVASGMMGVFKKIWENVWSARMEYILNNTILGLLDTPGTTLLGINRMLSDKEYRKTIVMNIKDPIVRQFWVVEFAGYSDKFASEAVAPIQNKVGQFLSASIIRNIVAQAKSTIHVREFMDEQKIFVINLSKGRIGEDASRLLGGMLITKIQMAAMERVDMPEADRQDFYLYVDEFQNFAVESFATILSEARKYRLNLIMAHQYIAQLTEEVRDAVFGNVGTMISFRVGSPDAIFMEDEFAPRFVPEDIINLPKYTIYLKLMIDGVTSQPFSAGTLPPIAHKTNSRDRVIEQSQQRYGGNRQHIESKVAEWSGFGEGVDLEAKMDEVKKEKKEAKKARFMHDYNCTRCNKEFKLPVELDRARPIYCEDCIPIIKEERKGGRKKGKREGQERRREAEKKPAIPRPKDTEVAAAPVADSVSLSKLDDKVEITKKILVSNASAKPKPAEPVSEPVSPLDAGSVSTKIVKKVEGSDQKIAKADALKARDVVRPAKVELEKAPAIESVKKNTDSKPAIKKHSVLDKKMDTQPRSSDGDFGDGTKRKRKRRRRSRGRDNSSSSTEGGGSSTDKSGASGVSGGSSVSGEKRPQEKNTKQTAPKPASTSQPLGAGKIVKFDE